MQLTHTRKLLQQLQDGQETSSLRTTLAPNITYSPDPLLPLNTSASHESTRKPSSQPFDSSTVLTMLVLLTALFFMGFFSVYIRRSSSDSSVTSRRRHDNNSSLFSSSLSSTRFHSSSKGGLHPSTVKSLPLVPYGGPASHVVHCAICLSEFEERETLKMIPCCRHVFHPCCIDTWLLSHVTCPLCRSTKISCGFKEEICLNVMHEGTDQGESEDSRNRLAVDESDTCRETVLVGVRRTRSCSSLEQCVALQRSRSF